MSYQSLNNLNIKRKTFELNLIVKAELDIILSTCELVFFNTIENKVDYTKIDKEYRKIILNEQDEEEKIDFGQIKVPI